METSILQPRGLVLRHEPYGELHPYIPLPYERQPRDPANGQPVTLNVETEHNPSAKTVWCVWKIDQEPTEHRENARQISTNEEFDHWQIQLPAFEGGRKVNYRLFAENEDEEIESEIYSFFVLNWVCVKAVNSISESGNTLELILSTCQEDLFLRLAIEPDRADELSFNIKAIRGNSFPASLLSGKYVKNWDNLRLTLQNDPCNFEIQRKSDGLTLKCAESMKVLMDQDGNILEYQFGFFSPFDEAFYGFGERFNAFNQRGNHLDNYVYGQYTNQGKRTYIPIPFFISSRGYGMWLKTNRQAEFDLAAERPDRWWVAGHAEEDSSFELCCFFQPRPYEIVKAFTDKTGKPKLPPAWVFGLWMSSNDWNSQVEVLHQLHETQKQKIPASVLVIEAWSDEINFYIWNDARYQIKPSSEPCKLSDFSFQVDGRWPDPKTMVDEIHQNGIRLVLWQNPAIKFGMPHEDFDVTLNKSDQAFAIEKGFVVKKADGSPHRVEKHQPWFGNSLVFDFTNPEAANWWFSKREYMVTEIGVDGFKTDGGEHIWDPETRFFNGTTGVTGINQYPVDYESAYNRFMQKLRGRDFVLFSRAGYTGSQLYPCHWAGDENSTWEAFRATLGAFLNVSLCGLPFMGWDIAGFAGPLPTSELYLRAAAFSVFCPIMQYHSDVNPLERTSRDRTPWNMQKQTGDERILPFFRKFADLRMNLLPYILDQVRLSSSSGLPLMRSMALVYSEDPTCRKYTHQYFFGDALLVAPVVNEGVTDWSVYLPEGEWRDLWTGQILQGNAELKVNVPLDRIPVYQKRGSLLALNLDTSGELGSPVGNSTKEYQELTLRIIPGDYFETQVSFTPDSDSLSVSVESSAVDGNVMISFPCLPRDANLAVSSKEPNLVSINGSPLSKLENLNDSSSKNGWIWNSKKKECLIFLKARSEPAIVVIH